MRPATGFHSSNLRLVRADTRLFDAGTVLASSLSALLKPNCMPSHPSRCHYFYTVNEMTVRSVAYDIGNVKKTQSKISISRKSGTMCDAMSNISRPDASEPPSGMRSPGFVRKPQEPALVNTQSKCSGRAKPASASRQYSMLVRCRNAGPARQTCRSEHSVRLRSGRRSR